MAEHKEIAAAVEPQGDGGAVLARHVVGDADHGGEELAQIDRLGILALHLGVEAARVRDVGNQPVEPFYVVLDDREQTRAAVLALGERQRLDRRAQRGQRVLELVRNVGREALDRLDAPIERAGHAAQ